MSTKILSIANAKGGVGKTTTTLNTGAALALAGYRVLIIDLDPQANLTQSAGIEAREHIGGALMGLYKLPTVQINESLYLSPANYELAAVEIQLATRIGRENVLKRLLQPISRTFDFILIDCPPSLSLLTVNAFTASDYLLIPLQAQYLAAQGLSRLLEVVTEVQQELNKDLKIAGVVATQYDSRKVLNRNIAEVVQQQFEGSTVPVFETKIRNNIALAEAPAMGLDIFQYAPDSNGAADYKALTNELLQVLDITVKPVNK